MKFRRFLFLSLGLTRVYSPQGRKHSNERLEKLLEPDGARVCRRNILTLACAVVTAGAAGADPQGLEVFGVKLADERALFVLGFAAILAHVYWYILRYFHLWDDGKIEPNPGEHLSINWEAFWFVRRGADLFSNWAAFVLTVLSWGFIVFWIFQLG